MPNDVVSGLSVSAILRRGADFLIKIQPDLNVREGIVVNVSGGRILNGYARVDIINEIAAYEHVFGNSKGDAFVLREVKNQAFFDDYTISPLRGRSFSQIKRIHVSY